MFDVAPSTFAETMPRMSCLAVRKDGSRENPDAAVVGQIISFWFSQSIVVGIDAYWGFTPGCRLVLMWFVGWSFV